MKGKIEFYCAKLTCKSQTRGQESEPLSHWQSLIGRQKHQTGNMSWFLATIFPSHLSFEACLNLKHVKTCSLRYVRTPIINDVVLHLLKSRRCVFYVRPSGDFWLPLLAVFESRFKVVSRHLDALGNFEGKCCPLKHSVTIKAIESAGRNKTAHDAPGPSAAPLLALVQ